MGIGLECDVAERDALTLLRLPFEALILRELRLHLRDQDAGGEWFLDIVIGAKAQPPDLVDVRPFRRDHHDRNVQLVPELPADLETVHPRQHDIQKDQVIVTREGLRQPPCPVDFHMHLVPADLQIILLNGCNIFIIFYDQYTFHECSSFGKEI